MANYVVVEYLHSIDERRLRIPIQRIPKCDCDLKHWLKHYIESKNRINGIQVLQYWKE